MKWLRGLTTLFAALLVLSACGVVGGEDAESDTEADTSEELSSEVAVADARLTVRSERDAVTVNGDVLDSGTFQDGSPGDVVEVDAAGSAKVTAESVFEMEGLRGAKITVPELDTSALTVGLEQGHVLVRLNPDANISIKIDAGDRQFTTKSPDAEFALCQAPNGASCLAVLAGEVEWHENDVATEVYGAGEASFAARGNAPDPTRCANSDAIGEMQRSLRGQDFAGTLADIVSTWEECTEDAAPLEVAEDLLPSAASMTHVVIPEPVIGSPDVDSDSETGIAEKPLDGPADYYIEAFTATNGDFRTWLVTAAGDDAEAWRRYAPQDWLDRAPGGAATQAKFADGTADDAVKGVAYSTAAAFCESQAKRLPTEIEWEVSAVNDILGDLVDESQDWVADWESYGPGPDDSADRQVLRGANGILAADNYFRVFALDTADATAARQNARVRCAADEVAIGGRTYETVIYDEEFNSLGWPVIDEDPLELDYHPENLHVDLTARHSEGAVVRALEEPLSDGRIDVDLFIERNNTGSDTGNFRFGVLIGSADQLYTLTIQPDNFGADRFLACLMPLSPELEEALALDDGGLTPDSSGRYASVNPGEGHYGEDCVDAASAKEVAVTNIDNSVRLTMVLVGGELELWVNDVLVDTSNEISSIGTYGFYSQLYHRDRSHIHYDRLTISGA